MGFKHYKFQPNEYVLVMKNGKVIKQGVGLSFFCNTLNTGMSVVPTVSFDTFFAFDDVLTSDFQGINIQGDISYIIRDYEKVAGMIDFSYTGESGYEEKKAEAKQVMGKRITNLAKTSASKFVNARDVKTVIHAQEELAAFLSEEMTSNEAITDLGLDVVTVSILADSPSLETKRALEAATREQILQQQDEAIYKRRNAAIEQERIVKENELNTEIKVAEKKHENEMLQQKNALEEVELESKVTKKKADARAYANEVVLKAMEAVDKDILLAILLSGMDSKTLIAKAFNSLVENTDKIGNLNISPDLLETLTSVGVTIRN
ncbi:SPFH domain-containing protein [Dorea formicigenerans]|uniref:SPFH domain-containing protein n=1 Tax=Dorea formicigenerans TaxID=39486 RepID=A0A412KER2_9FIRM|nr:SPFH domain-containing protein [Dorea formicigenerans]